MHILDFLACPTLELELAPFIYTYPFYNAKSVLSS